MTLTSIYPWIVVVLFGLSGIAFLVSIFSSSSEKRSEAVGACVASFVAGFVLLLMGMTK